jgi:hypothetical protein
MASNWELIYTTSKIYEAQMFKANIESAGIPVQILSQQDTSRMFTVGNLAVIKLYVPESDFEEAMNIIIEIEKNNDE